MSSPRRVVRANGAGKRFLLVKGRGGLGNRVLALLSGILYARLSGRTLVVDWSDPVYSDDGTNVFHGLFLCRSCDPAEEVPETVSVTPVIWRGRLELSVRELKSMLSLRSDGVALLDITSIDLARIDYPEAIAVLWGFTANVGALRPYCRGELAPLRHASTTTILRELLRAELEPARTIRERVDRFRRQRFAGGATIGVHVRYTDRKVRLPAILRRVDRILSADAKTQIFLATDSAKVRDLFFARYPDVVTAPHAYAPASRGLHAPTGGAGRLDRGVEALVDLYLLAECDGFVGDTTSSFARVASLLSNAPASRRFDVRPPRIAKLCSPESVAAWTRDARQILRAELESRRR